MSTLRLGLFCAGAALLAHAQYAPAPDAYTVTQLNAMMGAGATVTVYRDGSRAVVENAHSNPPIRSYYDLAAKKSISWSTADPANTCSNATFGGDWGDPFAMSAEMTGELNKKHAAPVGSETVNGFATKVYEADIDGGGKAKAWIESKYGLMVKLQMGPNTLIEIKQATFAKPAAEVFAVPPACRAAAAAHPAPPTEAERIAAETGGNPSDFANAIMGPSSKNGCNVLVRAVRAGSMQPFTGGFQLAVDKTVDPEHMPSYSMGVGQNGHLTYSGGGLTEVTAQMRQGTYRIENAPAAFYVDTGWGTGGESGGLIYRQCAGPETVLLLVVKNPQKLSDGADWLWVKSGKYAH